MSRKYSEEQVEMFELTLGEQCALETGNYYLAHSGEVRRNRRHRVHDRRLPIHPPQYAPTVAEVLAANPIERLLDYKRYPITDVDPWLLQAPLDSQ